MKKHDGMSYEDFIHMLSRVTNYTLKQVLFEPNTKKTWRRVKRNLWTRQIVGGGLRQLLNLATDSGAIHSGRIVCDNSTNTKCTIDRNELHGYTEWLTYEKLGVGYDMVKRSSEFVIRIR